MVPPSILDAVETEAQSLSARRMSEEEFVAWAVAGDVRAEWVNGEVILMSPVALKHVRISAWLQRVLGLYIEAKKLGEFLGPEFMVRLQHSGVSRRVPDLLFVSQANLHNLKTNHLEGPPDFAIEIVSPDSVARDWREKFLEYEASGVKEYWIIDPLTEKLEASVRNAEGKFVRVDLAADGVLHSATVPGFWLKPAWLWQAELPDPLICLRELGVTN